MCSDVRPFVLLAPEFLLSTNKTLSFSIALRYLAARRSALSYVSRLALFGLILSVTVLVIVISVVNGFERELRTRVLGVLPHMSIEGFTPLDRQEVSQFLDEMPLPGLSAAAAYVNGTVLVAAHGKIQGVGLTGITPAQYEGVTDLGQYTRSGSLNRLLDDRYGIVIGAKLSRALDIDVGDKVLIVLPVGAVTPAGAIPRQRHFNVVDIFDSQSQADGQTALINLSTAQRLFRTGRKVHGIHARLTDLFKIEAATTASYSAFGERRVRIRSWQATYGNLYQAIAVQKLTMFVLLSFLVAVAAFNLVSGLMMIVEQRKHDIAVLRTLGEGSRGILLLFCILGGALSFSGISIGMLTGTIIALTLPALYAWASATFELNLMTQYFIAYLPVDVRWQDLMQICLAAFTLSLLATIYPAWRATRLAPSEVLAHE